MDTKTKALITAAGASLLVAGAPAHAAPPTPHQLSIAAKPTRVVYGGKVAITGKLTGADNAGEQVTLSRDPFPFDTFSKVDTTLTTSTGAYGFFDVPTVNTKYQTDAKSKSPATSPEVLVRVAPKVTLKVSDKTPAKGQQVTFSGRVTPEHDGQVVKLQRRKSDGSWKTLREVALANTDANYSVYTFLVGVSRTGTYRVMKPKDADHAQGRSKRKKLTVSS